MQFYLKGKEIFFQYKTRGVLNLFQVTKKPSFDNVIHIYMSYSKNIFYV